VSRQIIKTSFPGRKETRSSLSSSLRRIISTITLPSVLTACAHSPHPVLPHPDNSAGPRSTVFHARPRSKRLEQYGEVAGGGSNPISLPSDVAIIENILSRQKKPSEPAAIAKREIRPAPKERSYLQSKKARSRTGLARSLKDGIWDRIRKRLLLTEVQHESVEAEIDGIRRSPAKLAFLSKRAEPFLFLIADEIDRRGLPMDLVMVPMVESAFDPAALSPKDAGGIWQIIPSTGQEHGLKQVEGYDGRYDVHAATKAALDYLTHLHRLFKGDWLLALAAYNAGEGAVRRAIEANQKAGQGTDFWDLALPAETKAYVPKILALSRVVADPQAYGVKLRKISAAPYLARFEINAVVPLADAVVGAGMSWEDFSHLNPAFKPGIVPSPPYNVLVPLDKAESLVMNLPGAKLIGTRKYVVKKGDTLSVIARRNAVSPVKLAQWNGLNVDSAVSPGQELVIYPIS